jgi:hypothetical protein
MREYCELLSYFLSSNMGLAAGYFACDDAGVTTVGAIMVVSPEAVVNRLEITEVLPEKYFLVVMGFLDV